MADRDFAMARYIAPIYACIGSFFKKNNPEIKTISHYTSTKVLDALLKNATFWASHILFQNDKNEYVLGVKELERQVGENAELGLTAGDLGIYTISFSDGTDLLQQWITYAKESGVSLEIDAGKLLDESGSFVFDFGCVKPGIAAKDVLHRMVYDDPSAILSKEAIRSSFNENIYEAYDGHLSSKEKDGIWANDDYDPEKKEYLRLLASYIKDKNFQLEKEIRASFIPGKDGKRATEIKYFQQDNGILRPYMEVTVRSDSENTGNFAECLPIKSITVGPSGNQQAVFDSVVHRIKYGENKVYNYYLDKDAFNCNFMDFFCHAVKLVLKNTSKSVTSEDFLQVYNLVAEEIKKEHSDWEVPNISACRGKSISELCIAGEKNIGCDDLYSYIVKNNYFSKEGIWVKKSAIPYIF